MNKLNILGAKMGLYGLRYDECRSSIVPASTKSTLIIEASFTAGSSDRSFQFSSKVPRKYSSILSADKYILFIDDLNGCFRREIPYYKAIREQGRCCYLRIPAFCEPCRALRQAIAVSQIAIHTFNEGYLHMLGLHVSLKRSEVSVLDDYYGTTSGKKRCIPYTFAWLEITLLKTSPIQSVSFDGTKTNSAETTLMPSTEVKQMRCGNDDAFTKKMKRSGYEHTTKSNEQVILSYKHLPPLTPVSKLSRTPVPSPKPENLGFTSSTRSTHSTYLGQSANFTTSESSIACLEDRTSYTHSDDQEPTSL